MPKLRLERTTDPAVQWDVFEQWLNQVQTSVATWSVESEEYWTQAVATAKEAYRRWLP